MSRATEQVKQRQAGAFATEQAKGSRPRAGSCAGRRELQGRPAVSTSASAATPSQASPSVRAGGVKAERTNCLGKEKGSLRQAKPGAMTPFRCQGQHTDHRLQHGFDRKLPDTDHPVVELEVGFRGARQPACVDPVDCSQVRLGPQEYDHALDRQFMTFFQQGSLLAGSDLFHLQASPGAMTLFHLPPILLTACSARITNIGGSVSPLPSLV